MRFQFWSQICPPTQFTLDQDKAVGGMFGYLNWGVLVMGIDHPLRSKQGRLSEPSLWADQPADDALSLLEENALQGDEQALWDDEPADDVHSLLEENARLRGLLVQLSDLILKNVVHSR
jgi:hypothetical protein